MVTDGGRQAPSIEEQLHDPSAVRLFDFFQAVALLEACARGASGEGEGVNAGVGEGGDPAREAVRFASSVRLSFATTDIAGITRAASGPPTMTVNFMGLAGALGPLPGSFAEVVLRRATVGDTAARDFLDIFNHRLVSLMVRVRKRHRIAFGIAKPIEDDAVRFLFALVGLGVPGLRGRLAPVEDRSLLFYGGLLTREIRSMSGLSTMLHCQFGVPVEGEPLVGGFYPIEPTHRTAIGPAGRNRRLGHDAILGARYWDPAACVEIRVGPLDVSEYLRFLPGTGDRLAPLVTLVRLYAGDAVDVRVRLVLDPAAAQRVAGRPRNDARRRAVRAAEEQMRTRMQTLKDRPRLGYTAWVGRPFERRDVVLQGAALRPDAGAAR